MVMDTDVKDDECCSVVCKQKGTHHQYHQLLRSKGSTAPRISRIPQRSGLRCWPFTSRVRVKSVPFVLLLFEVASGDGKSID